MTDGRDDLVEIDVDRLEAGADELIERAEHLSVDGEFVLVQDAMSMLMLAWMTYTARESKPELTFDGFWEAFTRDEVREGFRERFELVRAEMAARAEASPTRDPNRAPPEA